MQEQVAEEADKEMKAWRKAKAQHQQAKKDKHTVMARTAVEDLVSYALRIAEYREQTDLPVPKKEYRDWLALFLSGARLDLMHHGPVGHARCLARSCSYLDSLLPLARAS